MTVRKITPLREFGSRTSRLGYATSTDGIHFERDTKPAFYPAKDNQVENECPGGTEDPRIAMTEDGTYVLLYTQWNRKVPRLAVATSKDLKHWTKFGPALRKPIMANSRMRRPNPHR